MDQKNKWDYAGFVRRQVPGPDTSLEGPSQDEEYYSVSDGLMTVIASSIATKERELHLYFGSNFDSDDRSLLECSLKTTSYLSQRGLRKRGFPGLGTNAPFVYVPCKADYTLKNWKNFRRGSLRNESQGNAEVNELEKMVTKAVENAVAPLRQDLYEIKTDVSSLKTEVFTLKNNYTVLQTQMDSGILQMARVTTYDNLPAAEPRHSRNSVDGEGIFYHENWIP